MPRFPSCIDATTPKADAEAVSAWETASGLDWPAGQIISRKCGFSQCVNPTHIYPSYNVPVREEVLREKQAFFLHQYNTGAMATTQSLKKSPSEMTREEIEAELLELRKARRGAMKAKTSPTSKEVKKKAKKSRSKVSDLLSGLEDLSPEQLAILKKKLSNK